MGKEFLDEMPGRELELQLEQWILGVVCMRMPCLTKGLVSLNAWSTAGGTGDD